MSLSHRSDELKFERVENRSGINDPDNSYLARIAQISIASVLVLRWCELPTIIDVAESGGNYANEVVRTSLIIEDWFNHVGHKYGCDDYRVTRGYLAAYLPIAAFMNRRIFVQALLHHGEVTLLAENEWVCE